MNLITENMENPKKELLYQEVYDYFRDLILQNRLPAGSKMPSLRKCAQEMKYSRTTIENAYLQLAADGYIISRPQSGYYVTEIARTHEKKPDTKSRSSRRWRRRASCLSYRGSARMSRISFSGKSSSR